MTAGQDAADKVEVTRFFCFGFPRAGVQNSRHMKLSLFGIAFALVAAIPMRAAEEYEARTHTDAAGHTLGYRLLIPRNYDRATRYPLVLFLHGAGERGSDNTAQLRHGAGLFLKPQVREKFPCFVLAPQCPAEQKWTDIDWQKGGALPAEASQPTRLTLEVLEKLQQEFSIDPERHYVTGLSMGGYGTWDHICRAPERWAAAVPICGGGDPRSAARAKAIPVWAFHGDADRAVPVERTREMVAALRGASGHVYYSEYPGVPHDSWTAAYDEPELLPWLFAQRRGQFIAFEKAARPFAQPPSSEFPGEGPVQPGIWFRGLWQEKRADWAKNRERDKEAVVFLGDSITQGWSSLANDFPKLRVANRGISGDTTRGVRYRLQGDVLELHPKAVVLLIGTNDLGLGAAPEGVAKNVSEIIRELRAGGGAELPVIICKVMPSDASKQRPSDKIRRLNELVDQAVSESKDPRLIRVDTFSIFADENGNAKKEEFPDLLHPNATGYGKWRAALEPVFGKLGL
jgi:lysophospholipase L1-like esterase/poly(3-hydroxybutyrate) depolymerase